MLSISSDKMYKLWDSQNEVEALVSVPARIEMDGKTYLLVYLEEDEPFDESEDDPDEDGVCVLCLREKETSGSLFVLKDEDDCVLGYAEEPEEKDFDKVTEMLLSDLNR